MGLSKIYIYIYIYTHTHTCNQFSTIKLKTAQQALETITFLFIFHILIMMTVLILLQTAMGIRIELTWPHSTCWTCQLPDRVRQNIQILYSCLLIYYSLFIIYIYICARARAQFGMYMRSILIFVFSILQSDKLLTTPVLQVWAWNIFLFNIYIHTHDNRLQ